MRADSMAACEGSHIFFTAGIAAPGVRFRAIIIAAMSPEPADAIARFWDAAIVLALTEYIRIPAKSPQHAVEKRRF